MLIADLLFGALEPIYCKEYHCVDLFWGVVLLLLYRFPGIPKLTPTFIYHLPHPAFGKKHITNTAKHTKRRTALRPCHDFCTAPDLRPKTATRPVAMMSWQPGRGPAAAPVPDRRTWATTAPMRCALWTTWRRPATTGWPGCRPAGAKRLKTWQKTI